MSHSASFADLGPLPGKLFIVEGIDGSGKSTQLDLARKWLLSQGYLVYSSEWNSSPLVQETTRFGKAKRLLTPITFCLIHAADFADRLERAILPAMRAGAVVLADRYVYTAFARDVARGIHPAYVRSIYSFALKPTVAFYFRVPLQEAIRRILAGRPELKFYEAGMDLGLSDDPYDSFEIFQGRILDQYESMVDECQLHVIDATLPLVQQQAKMRELIRPHLSGLLRSAPSPLGEVLHEEGLTGRYLAELTGEWHHE